MTTRKNAAKIDPVQVAVLALKKVRTRQDYNHIVAANTEADIKEAWATLTSEEQQRINNICGATPQPDLQAIASELVACGTLIQLQAVKATYGEEVVRQAWKLIPPEERLRLKEICQGGQQLSTLEEAPAPVTEQPSIYNVETQPVEQPTKQPRRSLYSISQDMHQSADELEATLDATDDPDEQAQLIELWLQQNAGVQTEMLERVNAYLWVIRKQKQLAEYRTTESKRLRELADHSEVVAKRLEGQLLQFMDSHNLGKLETTHFKVSPRHASSEPLIVNEDYPIDQVPEEFVVVSRTVNRKLVKEAIKAGQQLPFAVLGTKTRYLYIR